MKKMLIADAGSTKTDWTLVNPDGTVAEAMTTSGINALMTPVSDITATVLGMYTMIGMPQIGSVFFYGAGCATSDACRKIKQAVTSVTECDECEVGSDMLGAARGLLGHNRGIACILGTGSNSCLYDGERIVDNTPSLGFILGDEGGGVSLGRRLVSDTYKGLMPSDLLSYFLEEFNLTLKDILSGVYSSSSANRFLASFVPFISQHISHPWLDNLVTDEFRRFFTRNVVHYEGAAESQVGFIGSVALNFKTQLQRAASDCGLTIGVIARSPMPGLIKYHTS